MSFFLPFFSTLVDVCRRAWSRRRYGQELDLFRGLVESWPVQFPELTRWQQEMIDAMIDGRPFVFHQPRRHGRSSSQLLAAWLARMCERGIINPEQLNEAEETFWPHQYIVVDPDLPPGIIEVGIGEQTYRVSIEDEPLPQRPADSYYEQIGGELRTGERTDAEIDRGHGMTIDELLEGIDDALDDHRREKESR